MPERLQHQNNGNEFHHEDLRSPRDPGVQNVIRHNFGELCVEEPPSNEEDFLSLPERYDVVLNGQHIKLPHRDCQEERPADLTPELRSRKHELTFELTCVTRLEET